MTEPGAAPTCSASAPRRVRDGDEYVISGSKIFITNGFTPTWWCVAVDRRAKPAAGRFAADARDRRICRAFACGRRWTSWARRRSDTTELFFDEVRVPVAEPAGRRGGPRLCAS
jgi:alkylation response protein AidB-like acyl-CoA dehydrogenase